MNELTGLKVGKLTVLTETKKDNTGKIMYECQCECGNTTWVRKQPLTNKDESKRTTQCPECRSKKYEDKRTTLYYEHSEGYMVGVLTSGVEFKFDSKHYDKVSKHSWYQTANGHIVSRYGHIGLTIQLHRLIMNLENVSYKDIEVDHIDSDKLNNLDSNLRKCTHKENSYNKSKQKGEWTSIYKGVSYRPDRSKWVAKLWKDNKSIHLGYFKTEEEAAKAYNRAACREHGEFAKINDTKNESVVSILQMI